MRARRRPPLPRSPADSARRVRIERWQTSTRSYKFLFSTPELVRDLIIGFVPDDWLHSLDYSTLEKVSGSYITEDFRNRADDNAQGGIPYRIASNR